jgi:ribosome-binding factor A
VARSSSRPNNKAVRRAGVLREVIASELVLIDDERLQWIAITTVDVDPEMNRAIVYFDSMSDESGDAEILEALGEHRRRLQATIGRQVRAKKTPILDFRPDEVIRSAARIEKILREASTLPERPIEPE